jgi:PKD repeat protein
MFHIGKILLLVIALVVIGLAGWPLHCSVCGREPTMLSPFHALTQSSPDSSPPVLVAAAAQQKANEEQAPTADFSADRVEIRPDMEIRFLDESTGKITSWLWDFGDGGTSTQQNPTHVYLKNGYYTVTLKVTGPQGSDTVKKVEFIRVSEDCNC